MNAKIENTIKDLDASKIEQLKLLAKVCAKGTCGSLATMFDIPIGMVETECIYPPMYKMVSNKARLHSGPLIFMAADIKAAGRSRLVLTLTKADAAELVDRGNKVPVQPSRVLVDEDRVALMNAAKTLIENYLVPLAPYLGSPYSITPPVVSFDVIKGNHVPSKVVQLISGYSLMMETHFIDRSGRIRGGAMFLPDGHLQKALIEGIKAK